MSLAVKEEEENVLNLIAIDVVRVITLYLRNRGDSPLSDCGHELRQ